MTSKQDKEEELAELEKGKAHIIIEIMDYKPNTVHTRTIIKRATGNITITSFDTGGTMPEKVSPFDTFIQIIDGSAEVTIGNQLHHLQLGHGITIPAHSTHIFNAKEPFKMISTVIKSGYEDQLPGYVL